MHKAKIVSHTVGKDKITLVLEIPKALSVELRKAVEDYNELYISSTRPKPKNDD